MRSLLGATEKCALKKRSLEKTFTRKNACLIKRVLEKVSVRKKCALEKACMNSFVPFESYHPVFKSHNRFRLKVVYSRPMIAKRNGHHHSHLSCSTELNKGYDNCLKEAFDRLFFKHLGCYYPFMTKIKDRTKYCNFGNFTALEKETYWSIFSGKFF